ALEHPVAERHVREREDAVFPGRDSKETRGVGRAANHDARVLERRASRGFGHDTGDRASGKSLSPKPGGEGPQGEEDQSTVPFHGNELRRPVRATYEL